MEEIVGLGAYYFVRSVIAKTMVAVLSLMVFGNSLKRVGLE